MNVAIRALSPVFVLQRLAQCLLCLRLAVDQADFAGPVTHTGNEPDQTSLIGMCRIAA